MYAKTLTLALALSLGAGTMVGCTSTTPPNDNVAQTLKTEAAAALDEMKRSDPGVADLLSRAYGYAIYPDATKAAFLVGAAYGRGEVYEQGRFVGYSTVNKGSIGAQAGAMNFSQLIVFENKAAFDRFTRGEWAPAATASAVILKAGAAATTTFKDGVIVLINTRGGAMVDASIGGQKFTFAPASRPEDVR